MLKTNISLKPYNTFGLEANAKELFSFTSVMELDDFIMSYKESLSDILILGGGSNVLFSKDYTGTILHSKISYIKTVNETETEIFLEAGSGLNWDEFVQFCVKNKYYGAENMSLIPGNIGATAVQNAGAYGTEAKDLIVTVKVYDLFKKQEIELTNSECNFEYRNSIFKSNDFKDKILITSIVYRLSKISKFQAKLLTYQGSLLKRHFYFWKDFIGHFFSSINLNRKSGRKSFLDYRFLKNLLEDSGLLPLAVKRKIVIKTRTSKLPDINKLGNVGSFFKNPIISLEKANNLKNEYPDVILFPYLVGEMKVSAAWLIHGCGWSGKTHGDAGSLEHLPLTIVNYGNATSYDILTLAKNIEEAVLLKYDIVLEKEVVIV